MKLPPIAIYCSSRSWGGLEMNTLRLSAWMAERDHQITLFCMHDSPLATYAAEQHVPVRYISRNNRYFDLPRAIVMKKELERSGIRVLILVDNRDLDFGVLVKLLYVKRIRLIYQQHMRLGIRKRDPIHIVRFRQLDAWITLLPYMKKEILSKTTYPEKRIHLIPLGLDVTALRASLPTKEIAREQLKLPEDVFTIGILGRLDPQKGQHIVIEALALLKEQGVSCLLLVMGETTRNEGEDYLQKLQQLVVEKGMQDHVFFRGYHENITGFYAAIDLFVLGSYEETYGMVTIEGMLCGVPVVGSRAGGTTELLGNGEFGWLYQPKDPADLARTIIRVKSDPKQLQYTVTAALEHALKAYSHTEECIKIEELLRSLT
ncbi:MAG: glycosyltransferase family 4 protein [Bacteroidales bacterium]|nr:glycosyltransferase family 4 protein [Bacteroidales bacterium]